MPFAPNVQDRRDQLVMAGSQEIAKYNYEGARALGAGIAAGVKSAASSLGDAIQGMQERSALASENSARANAWLESGAVDKNPKLAGVFARAAGEKDPYKQAGYLNVGDALMRQEGEKERVQFSMDQARQLAQDKATIAANAPGRVLKTANGFVQQINGSWVPVTDPQGNPVAAPVTGSGGGQNIGTALEVLSQKADAEEIARIQAEIAAGNQKPGPDWLPDGLWFGARPFNQQLEEKQAAVVAGGGASSGGAPQAWQSAEQVKAAVQGGQLSREAGRQILQSQFGYR